MDQFIETLGVYNTVSQQLTESVFFFYVIPALIFCYTLIINFLIQLKKITGKIIKTKLTQESLLWKLRVNLKKKQKDIFKKNLLKYQVFFMVILSDNNQITILFGLFGFVNAS